MATPEQPKNYITKGISKTLLTPCRRIGLSRSKNTPKSVDSPLLKLEPKSTPLSTLRTPEIKRELEQTALRANEHETPVSVLKSSVSRKKIRKSAVTSVKVEAPLEALQTPNTNKDLNQDVSERNICKAPEVALNKFINTKPETTNVNVIENNDTPVRPECSSKTVNNQTCSPPTSPVITKVKVQVHHPPVKRNINFNQLETESTRPHQVLSLIDNNSLDNSPVARQKKRKLCVIDSDDESSTVSTKSSKVLSKFTTEEYLEEYSKNPESFAASLTQDSDFLDVKTVCVSAKINEIDNKNKDYVAIYYPITASHSSDTYKEKELTVSLEKLPTKKSNSSSKLSLSKLSFDTENSDDEIFTSSPVDDKKRKENLMKLIDDMKVEVRRKQETLEKLRQAQIYKKIHSPDKLKNTTNMWLKGCKRGLQDLHQKMQEIGPMNLNTLISKLGIPESVIKKLE